MDSLHRLEEIFGHFPGIGPRQAKRFVYYLLNKSPSAIKELTDLIEEVKRGTAECAMCHRFFLERQKKDGPICNICSDPNRDRTTLMIVARDSDFETVERSAAYRGLYFILGGSVPILDKDPDKRIRLRALLERLGNDSAKLKEIILSMNTTPDGEHTADIVRDAIARLHPTKVSILGRGLSTGAELEYADGETIKSALENRH